MCAPCRLDPHASGIRLEIEFVWPSTDVVLSWADLDPVRIDISKLARFICVGCGWADSSFTETASRPSVPASTASGKSVTRSSALIHFRQTARLNWQRPGAFAPFLYPGRDTALPAPPRSRR